MEHLSNVQLWNDTWQILHQIYSKAHVYNDIIFLSRGKKCKPIYVQIARQVVKLKPQDLRLPARAWKVK